jgi:CRISPR-associated protein Cas2
MFVVVAYDIADDRRRLKVMTLLEGYGRRVQESVFECDLEGKDYRALMQRLQRLISLRADNVRCYHLCNADVKQIETLGVGRPVERRKAFEIV